MEHHTRVSTRSSQHFRIAQLFDDDKFTDMGINLFESVYPGQSDYYILKTSDEPFRYVSSPLAIPVSVETQQQQTDFAMRIQSRCAAVFLHAMNYKRQQIALRLPDNIVKVWFIWGYDLYLNWPALSRGIFDALTASYLRSRSGASNWERIKFSRFGLRLFRKSVDSNRLPVVFDKALHRFYPVSFYKAVRSMDVVVPIVPTEYELVESLGVSAVYAPFTYGNLEHLLGDKISENVLHSRHILVGNSADPSNNHVDVFEKLSRLDLGDKQVYVPLSYAGDAAYKAFVIERGFHYLGDRFVPLTDFMKLEDYNRIIAGCGFLIFNHIRQQGVGNIIAMGAMGAKIFLNEKSPVFKYYKDLGIALYATSELSNATVSTNLDPELWAHNRKIYFEQYSAEAVKVKARQLLEIVRQQIYKKQK